MKRFGTSGSSTIRNFALPHIKKKALNSWSAIQDTYFSTKDTFERHKVVFTISTSVASVATAWLGYTLRHLHETKVEQRLDSIENADARLSNKLWIASISILHILFYKICFWKTSLILMVQGLWALPSGPPSIMKSNYHMEHSEFKKLVGSSSSGTAAYVATAGTSLIIGYGFGWRGGKWYANRKFRKEQMKLLGQIKPRKWPLKFLRRPLIRPKLPGSSVKTSEAVPKDLHK